MKKIKLSKILIMLVVLSLTVFVVTACDTADDKTPITEASIYTLTMEAPEGEGTVTPGVGAHEFDADVMVDLEAEPASGWYFKEWEGEVQDSSSSSTKIKMNKNQTVRAVFTEDPGVIGGFTVFDDDDYYSINYPENWLLLEYWLEYDFSALYLLPDPGASSVMAIYREELEEEMNEEEFISELEALEEELLSEELEGYINIISSEIHTMDGQPAISIVMSFDYFVDEPIYVLEKNIAPQLKTGPETFGAQNLQVLNEEEESAKLLLVITYKADQLFWLEYIGDEEIFDKYYAAAREVVNSFKFKY